MYMHITLYVHWKVRMEKYIRDFVLKAAIFKKKLKRHNGRVGKKEV